MKKPRYKVIEARWQGGIRHEVDIGCNWKEEKLALKEMKELQAKHPTLNLGITKEGKSNVFS